MADFNERETERLSYLEQLLLWRGSFNLRDIYQHFGVTEQTIRRDLDKYKAFAPQNEAVFNAQIQRFICAPTFAPKFILKNFADFLQRQHYAHSLPLPKRELDVALCRQLVSAIESRGRLYISYYSESSGDYEARIIQPHSLVFALNRWHVRAYCEKKRQFSDFVLSRFYGDATIEECHAAYVDIEQDADWQQFIELTLMVDPRLSAAAAKGVATDYAMVDGQLTLNVRKALLNYLIEQLGLHRYHENPAAQQIIIEPNCRERIKQLLW